MSISQDSMAPPLVTETVNMFTLILSHLIGVGLSTPLGEFALFAQIGLSMWVFIGLGITLLGVWLLGCFSLNRVQAFGSRPAVCSFRTHRSFQTFEL